MTQRPYSGLGVLMIRVSRSHSDTQHSVGLVCTNDQPVAPTSAWQNPTLTRDRPSCPGGIPTHIPNKRAAAGTPQTARSLGPVHENINAVTLTEISESFQCN